MNLRTLILFHLVRFVGVYFLVLHQRGELPGRFAITAGWGDIVVAVGATMLVFSPRLRASSRAVLVWNTVGLIDILLVVITAAGLAFANRDSMSALTRLPLAFLPTLVVPLIISTHVAIFVRLLKRSAKQNAPHPAESFAPITNGASCETSAASLQRRIIRGDKIF